MSGRTDRLTLCQHKNGVHDSVLDTCSSSTPTRTGPSRPTCSPSGRRRRSSTASPASRRSTASAMWVFDGHPMGQYSAGGVIGRDGTKESAAQGAVRVGRTTRSTWAPTTRRCASRCSTSAASTPRSSSRARSASAARTSAWSTTRRSCRLAIEIYNDGMAEIQADSGNRLLPLPLMPAWDVDTCVAEAQRVAGARAPAAST